MIKKFENFNNTPPKIYLAGGWSGWRDIVIKYFPGVNFLDPRKVGGGPDSNKINWFNEETRMINESDGTIAWVVKDNKSGFGMTFEMGMTYGLNKPYVLINEKEDKYQWGMQSSGADFTADSYKDVFNWIVKTNWLGLKLYYNNEKF